MREFVMGARITLKDTFSNPMRNVIRATDKFKQSVNASNHSHERMNSQFRSTQHGAHAAAAGIKHAGDAAHHAHGGFVQMYRDMLKMSGVMAAVTATVAAPAIAAQSTIGEAITHENSVIVIDAMFDDKKLSKQYQQMLEKFAIDSPVLDSQTMFKNSKSFISMSKDADQLKEMWGLAERLAAVDPVQGVEGAVFALRELFSGDSVSLQERFEIPKSELKAIRKLPLNEQLKELDKLFNKIGMTQKLIDAQGGSVLGLWNRIKEQTAVTLREMGGPATKEISKFLKGIVNGMGGGDGGTFKKIGTNIITGVTKGVIFGAKLLYKTINFTREAISKAYKVVAPIAEKYLLPPIKKVVAGFKWLQKAANDLYTLLFTTGEAPFLVKQFGPEKVQAINNFFWDVYDKAVMFKDFMVNTAAPAIESAINKIITTAKNLANYFITNFSKFQPYIIGIATAFLTYAAYLKIAATVTKVVTAAQKAFNLVMAMNPMILVLIAIGLLIGYLIHLAGGWDKAKEKLLVFWQFMVNAWNSIVATVVPIIISLVQTIVSWFMRIWATVQPLLLTIWTGIVNVFNSLASFWATWGGLISAFFAVWWAFVSSIFMSAVSVLWTVVKGAFDVIYNIISGVFKVISGVIQIGWALITGIFSTALNLLSGNWSGAWDSMLGMLSGVWSGIEDFFSGLKDLFFDSGVAIIKTLAKGIASVASAPFKAVSAALGKVRELLPFSDAKTGPLSSLTTNGGKIVSTMAEGVYSQAGTLHRAMSDTLADTPTTTSGTVTANANRISAAGPSKKPRSDGGGTQIKNLIEKLIIQGTDKDGKAIADEVIEAIYEKLSQANDILSAADMGALLND